MIAVVRTVLLRLLLVGGWITMIIGCLHIGSFTKQFSNNSINIFVWGNIFDVTSIEQFERETGIQVNINYYASNEELIAKLTMTHGIGYDLVIPTDYAVKTLINSQLLQPIDHTQLNFLDHIDTRLLHHDCDPENRYSIPLSWECFCLGIDADFFSEPIESTWAYIFKHPFTQHYRIAMTNQSGEAFEIAANYLGITARNSSDIAAIGNLLHEQRTIVEAYTDARPDYFLLTKNCPVVVGTSSHMVRCMRTMPSVKLILPHEGSIMTIEHCAIPSGSTKAHLVYKLLNFMYQPEIVLRHVEKFAVCPAYINEDIVKHVDPEIQRLIQLSPTERKNLQLFTTSTAEQTINELWISIKS